MHFSTFSVGFALVTCRFDSLLWKIIPLLLDSGNKVEFFRLTQTSFFVRRKNSTLFPSSSKSGIIFHSALSNLQVRNAKRTEKVEKCISLEPLFFLTERKYSLTLNCQESTIILCIARIQNFIEKCCFVEKLCTKVSFRPSRPIWWQPCGFHTFDHQFWKPFTMLK